MDQSSEQSADRSMDQGDGRWLTYPELAAVRGIDKPSAIRLATRKKWRRQRDNRRVVRVLVPPEWLSPRYQSTDLSMDHQGRDTDLSSDRPDFAALLAAVEAAHAGEVAALHGQITGLKTMADHLGAQLADAGARADRAEKRIEELQAGQTLMAETHATDLAAVIQRAQDAAEETIRQRVERLEHDRATSVAIADEAVRAAEHLRQAARDGNGRGRWARLRAAWRGE